MSQGVLALTSSEILVTQTGIYDYVLKFMYKSPLTFILQSVVHF